MNRSQAIELIKQHAESTGQNWLIIQAATIGILGFQQDLTKRQIHNINALGHNQAMKVSNFGTQIVDKIEKVISRINDSNG